MTFDEETMNGEAITVTARCNEDPHGRGWTVDVITSGERLQVRPLLRASNERSALLWTLQAYYSCHATAIEINGAVVDVRDVIRRFKALDEEFYEEGGGEKDE